MKYAITNYVILKKYFLWVSKVMENKYKHKKKIGIEDYLQATQELQMETFLEMTSS